MPRLNRAQQAAIRHIDGPLLVLAGAGSGKTRVITHKIAHLVRECGIDAERIAALTFTNKAAREMRERAGEILGPRGAQGLTVTTFHSLGLRILQREHAAAGLKPGFSIFDGEDARALVGELLRQGGGESARGEADAVRERISRWKSALVEPDEAGSGAEDATELRAARTYRDYQRHLRAYNAADFDDLIALPVAILRDDPGARERWQNCLRYLLVDEGQDTNDAQYRLLRLLAGPRARFTVVGDDAQSVYAWRGARPENLHQLQADFPQLEVIKLEQNYRSTGRILSAANRLIAHNTALLDKQLWSELGPGEPVRVIACSDAEAEAERVVSELLHQRFRKRDSWGGYAVLYRSNHLARPFEKALRAQGIPYRVSGGQSFFERAEVRDLLAYLRLLVNPDDDAAFLRVVNTPRREIGAATLEKLGRYASERGVAMLAACTELGLGQHLAERPAARLQQFAGWLQDSARRAATDDAARTLRSLLADLDYEGWLHASARDTRTAERRMANVEDLVGWIENLTRQAQGERTLADILGHISLMGILERGEDDSDDRVQLMTLHAAKGLEFDHVFLVGIEEDLLPHRSSIEAEDLDEERRLAYVGLTRARRTATLSYAARRRRGGEEVEREPSRFLAELPADELDWQTPDRPADPERSRERGEAHIAALRDLLGDAG